MITDKIKDDEDSAAVLADWRFAAMVLDRYNEETTIYCSAV